MNSQTKFQKIRRKDREISINEAWEMITSGMNSYGFLGTHWYSKENKFPYVVPMNFFFDQKRKCLYLHSTNNPTSKRYRILKENNKVTFVVVGKESILDPDSSGKPCNFSMNYSSIMVFGLISEINGIREKTSIMNRFVKGISEGIKVHKIQSSNIGEISVWKLVIKHISGKKRLQP